MRGIKHLRPFPVIRRKLINFNTNFNISSMLFLLPVTEGNLDNYHPVIPALLHCIMLPPRTVPFLFLFSFFSIYLQQNQPPEHNARSRVASLEPR